MIEVKKFIGSFTGSVYSHYTHKDLNIYQLILIAYSTDKRQIKHLYFMKK